VVIGFTGFPIIGYHLDHHQVIADRPLAIAGGLGRTSRLDWVGVAAMSHLATETGLARFGWWFGPGLCLMTTDFLTDHQAMGSFQYLTLCLSDCCSTSFASCP